MEITCVRCSASFELIDNFNFKYYTCPSCNSNYKYKSGEFVFLDTTSQSSYVPKIKIGAKGIIDTIAYTVVNYVHKKNEKGESWFEYQLVSKSGEIIYLTEEAGHWSLEKSITINSATNKETILYNAIEFKKYEVGKSKEYYRVGFFEDKLDTGFSHYEEFIAPPFGISIETNGKHKDFYLGEYISQKEIKKILATTDLKPKNGIGALQPFYYNLSQVYTIFIIGILLTTLLHIVFYTQSKEQLIFENVIDLDKGNNKEKYTNVFTLNGPIAPLNITVASDVDNSWITTDFVLINEETGEQVYFAKDLEYYYGNSEGENWNEGSKQEEFNICGVSSGKYKIMVLPSKEENSKNSYLRLKIYWGKPDNWNLYVSIFIFLALGVILFIIKNNFENKRWEDNYYSPYKKDK
ncbi:DUF4178 domain-containing protein [Flavobacterium sp. J27]|uniref:DUF4178 domain-containing protein n=1 Tax=Flavobacterium sp. J27 TaxID=2060419 RepID=UPI001030ABF3|nr:DUF4178 domain-containing protein [Flavobacterium sp. J27]